MRHSRSAIHSPSANVCKQKKIHENIYEMVNRLGKKKREIISVKSDYISVVSYSGSLLKNYRDISCCGRNCSRLLPRTNRIVVIMIVNYTRFSFHMRFAENRVAKGLLNSYFSLILISIFYLTFTAEQSL